ncbi:Ada metal-binding domain-containing protein [Spirosoma luteum]|uniref:Ada metal-binding domain-containing protein n=1 Tax=Spirosoma luteum TaxID=431553 RepID=UPI000380D426|nr:Ada metal-binding domain-containing protein [Spirosoma luteum]
MVKHTDLGPTRYTQVKALARLKRSGNITLAGHAPGKIYGRLNCRAGKRMKTDNRVFFRDAAEAMTQGFRPCAICMRAAYRAWVPTTQ